MFSGSFTLYSGTFQVRVDGHVSSPFSVTSGLFQGSHLVPRMFLVVINDIGHNIRSVYPLFADVLIIFRCIRSCIDFQGDMDGLMNWCESNNLKLNIGKFWYMICNRFNNITEYNLGVYLD